MLTQDSKVFEKSISALLKIFLTLIAIRIAILSAQYVVDAPFYHFFASIDDIFADSLKSAIAQTAISQPLFEPGAIKDWPPRFAAYVTNNPYLNSEISILHATPLATLELMLVAFLLLVLSPGQIVLFLILTYFWLCYWVSRQICRSFPSASPVPVAALIALAYPSLFMLNRGNLPSGITSLGVIYYVWTAYTGQSRRAGWVALAIAINFRPNVAIFSLIELVSTTRRFEAVRNIAIMAVLSITIMVISFVIAHGIDPRYSVEGFLSGYARYEKIYVQGYEGVGWNASLANIVKLERWRMGVEPFNALASFVVNIFGLIMITASALTGWFRRMSFSHYTFVICALCCLFTPVIAEYHLLIILGPLFILVAEQDNKISNNIIQIICPLIFIFSILYGMSYIKSYLNYPRWLYMIVVFIIAACPFFTAFILKAKGQAYLSVVLIAACIAALSPLGQERTQGMAVAFLLLPALIWLMGRQIFVKQGASVPPPSAAVS